jgi:hypothetical protein
MCGDISTLSNPLGPLIRAQSELLCFLSISLHFSFYFFFFFLLYVLLSIIAIGVVLASASVVEEGSERRPVIRRSNDVAKKVYGLANKVAKRLAKRLAKKAARLATKAAKAAKKAANGG